MAKCMVNARYMLQVYKLILEALASELQGKKKKTKEESIQEKWLEDFEDVRYTLSWDLKFYG